MKEKKANLNIAAVNIAVKAVLHFSPSPSHQPDCDSSGGFPFVWELLKNGYFACESLALTISVGAVTCMVLIAKNLCHFSTVKL